MDNLFKIWEYKNEHPAGYHRNQIPLTILVSLTKG